MATNTEKILAVALIATIITAAALVIIFTTYTIHNVGSINVFGFSLWANVNRTGTLASINWGSLNRGDVKGVSCWAQNTGNQNQTLSFKVYNWQPINASKYLTFGWNYTTGSKLLAGQVEHLLLTLTVATNTTGVTNFSFDINMTATEVS